MSVAIVGQRGERTIDATEPAPSENPVSGDADDPPFDGPTLEIAAEHPLLAPSYCRWFMTVMLMVMIVSFADRAIISVLAQPIKEDLQLTDTDLGIIQGLGFSILYACLGIPLGILAERASRKLLIAASITVWSIVTALCGAATNFFTLLLCRIGVGIGEAGVMPPAVSLISDQFPPSRRGSMLGVLNLGAPIGFLVGQVLGGWIASQWGWRMAFYVMGVPGVLFAVLVLLTLREPPRGLVEGTLTDSKTPPPSTMEVVRYLFAKPAFRHLLIGFTLANFTMNAIANFVLPFFMRGFDVSLAEVSLLFGVVTFTSNGIGMLLGGFGFDWLRKRDLRWPVWGPGITLLAGIPFYLAAFYSRNYYVSMAFVWLGNMTVVTFMAPTLGSMQNMAGPRMRAMTSALSAMIVALFGAGLGPAAVGFMSDHIAGRIYPAANFISSCPGGRAPGGPGSAADTACLAASGDGLRYALMIMLVVLIWASYHYFRAGRTLRRDLYRPPVDDGRPAHASVGAAADDTAPLPS
jgi:predicted MFS family arabinose efflux permease